MKQPQPDLEALRREIDEIDDRLHDLVMRRAEVVQRVAAVKGVREEPKAVLRPGREAMILRRLMARHRGVLPRAVVARIWRELIAALCRVQGPMSLAVLAPEKSVGYCDMARRHYGSSAPMALYRSAGRALRAIGETPGTIGILPMPQDGEDEPWWVQLALGESDGLRVIARLPFVPSGEGNFEPLAALAVANAEPEPSGADESLLAAQLAAEVSRARITEILRQAGFAVQGVAAHRGLGLPELQLYAAEGFVAADDARLARAQELSQGAIGHIKTLGAYALPIEE
ncbi:MAG: chorismate mutase [Alphaproteobacteria bacterium]|nr:chorismate mutase [Alphaproteobacteria bacterium]